MTANTSRGYRKDAQDAENDAEALRLQTLGYTFREIGDLLGVNASTACRRANRALKAIPAQAVEEHRALEVIKLDEIEQRLWEIVGTKHYRLSSGGRVVLYEGKPLIDDGPTLRAVTALLRVMESRAKLMGLNAPEGYAWRDTAPSHLPEPDKSTRESLMAFLSSFEAEGRGPSACPGESVETAKST